MSEQKSNSQKCGLHTPEPWKVSILLSGCVYIEDRDSDTVCDFYFKQEGEFFQHPNAEANARRIVACVNACAGVDTETIEAILANKSSLYAEWVQKAEQVIEFKNERDALAAKVKELEAQNDIIVNKLKSVVNALDCIDCDGQVANSIYRLMDDVAAFIAKIEAEKQNEAIK